MTATLQPPAALGRPRLPSTLCVSIYNRGQHLGRPCPSFRCDLKPPRGVSTTPSSSPECCCCQVPSTLVTAFNCCPVRLSLLHWTTLAHGIPVTVWSELSASVVFQCTITCMASCLSTILKQKLMHNIRSCCTRLLSGPFDPKECLMCKAQHAWCMLVVCV